MDHPKILASGTPGALARPYSMAWLGRGLPITIGPRIRRSRPTLRRRVLERLHGMTSADPCKPHGEPAAQVSYSSRRMHENTEELFRTLRKTNSRRPIR